MDKAVLLITFNRLDNAKLVFEQIKIAKPKKLYLASDGPREERKGEFEKVQEVRNYLLANVDWECDVKTKFEEKNLGCGLSVKSAVDWLFENEEDGIILEDDCVPTQSFFKLCKECLDKYKENKEIWQISGYAYHSLHRSKNSYWFAKKVNPCWGWATWKNRWENYDFTLNNYKDSYLDKIENEKDREFTKDIVEKARKGLISHTWDYQWNVLFTAHEGIAINPYMNQIKNIGTEGTHFDKKHKDWRTFTKTFELKEINHPEKIEVNLEMQDEIRKRNNKMKERIKYGAFPFIYKKEKIDNKRIITILNFIKFSYTKKKKELSS